MNEKDNNEVTGFHLACKKGHLKVVKYLISLQCDTNQQDIKGKTGFIHACEQGNLGVVKYLISLGHIEKEDSGFNASLSQKNIELQILLLEYGSEITEKISKEKYSDLYNKIENRRQEIQNVKETILNFWPEVDLRIIDGILEFTHGEKNLNRTIFLD